MDAPHPPAGLVALGTYFRKIREHIAAETAYAVSAAIRKNPIFNNLGEAGLRVLLKATPTTPKED